MPDPLARLTAALADRYTLEHEIGAGGMATVYLARDVKHDRPVAIKVMRPEIAAALGGDRFLREIALAAPLQHPHILTLIDSGDAGGVLYYVMPWVDGETLAARLGRERQLPLDEALRLATEIAEALEYAHRHGVVHRDIKPDNILLAGGHAIVMDFGVARAIGTGDLSRLTDTGIAVGTPAYMSPEQAVGDRELDGRTDIYALGCVLYEMLVGEPPYTGPTPQVVMARRLVEPVPRISVARGAVGPGLEAVIEKALARTPADRWATAAEFATALRAPAAPVRRRRPVWQRPRVVAGAVVLASVGVVTAVLARRRPAPALSPVTLRRFTVSGAAWEPRISPDGKRLAYVVRGKTLVVQSLDGGEPVVLVPTSRMLAQPQWTGDGSAILFWMFRDSLTLAGTWMVPSGGGAARQVLDDQDAFDAGPDSTMAIRYHRPQNALQVVELATGEVRERFPLPDSVVVDLVDGVAWSPDQRLVALGAGGLWLLRLADSTLRLVAPEGTSPRWDPSGRSLYFLADLTGDVDLWRLRVDGGTGGAIGKPARVLSLPRAVFFDVGSEGQLVVDEISSSSQAWAMTIPRRPGRVEDERVVSTGSAAVTGVAISEDGRSLAIARDLSNSTVRPSRLYGKAVIELVPFDGGAVRPLPPSSVSQFGPRWAPGGARLTVVRADSAGNFVTLVSIADGSARRLGTRPATFGFYGFPAGERAEWSADGSRVVYLAGPKQLVVVDPERLTETAITIPDSIGSAALNQVLSPHGDTILVSTGRRPTDWPEQWLVDVATQRWSRMMEPFGQSGPLRWLPDGTIYVANDRVVIGDFGQSLLEIWAVRTDGSRPRFVAYLPDGCVEASISADGRRVACSVRRNVSDLLLATDFAPGGP